MALTHADFNSYPIKIAGIDKSEGSGESLVYLYDAMITGLETFVISDMAYTGDVTVSAVLKYFVYYLFCQEQASTVTANAGENVNVDKVSMPSKDKQVFAWNYGVESLRTLLGITKDLIEARIELFECDKIHSIVEELGISINQKYLNKRSLL